MPSDVFCSPQPKDVQFTLTEEERNQEIFTFKKLGAPFFSTLRNDYK